MMAYLVATELLQYWSYAFKQLILRRTSYVYIPQAKYLDWIVGTLH